MAVNLEDILRELQGIKSALSKSNTSSSGGFANSYFGDLDDKKRTREIEKKKDDYKAYIEERIKLDNEAADKELKAIKRNQEFEDASHKRKLEMQQEELAKSNENIANNEKLQKALKKELDENIKKQKELLSLKERTQEQDEELKNIEEKIKELGEDILETNSKINKENAQNFKIQHELSKTSKIKAWTKDYDEFANKVKGAVNTLNNFIKPWAEADAAASKFTKTLGGTKAAMDRLRKDTLDSVATGIGVKFNMSTEELLQAQQDYLKGVGRNVSVDDASRESMAAIARFSKDAGIDGLGFAAELENFGVSIDKTGDHLGKMFADASKSGISFQKYSDNVAKNIKLAQNYTFKNGIKGLESMAKKATSLKLDMQQVANFADKVSTVEGALETSAKLQVLGGPFASMSDPMGMLYEGLNDMEGLQDRVIKMIGGLGNFNKQTGEVNVSAFDKQRIKAAAEAMGMDYSKLMESVNQKAKQNEIGKQINSSIVAGKFDDDMKELIKNTGVIKDGKVGINVNGKFKTLDEIDPEKDRKILEAQTRTESEDIKQIAMDLRSLVDLQQGAGKQKDAIQAEIASPVGTIMKSVLKLLDFAGIAVVSLGTLVVLQQAAAFSNALGGFGKMGKMFNKIPGVGKSGNFFKGMFSKGPKLPKGTKFNSSGKLIDAKTGRFVSTKSLGKGATKSVAKSATQGLGKSLLSAGAKGGGAAMGALGTVAGGASLLGLGVLGNQLTNHAVKSGKIEKGGTGHHVAKVASGALTGAGAGIMAAGGLTALGTMVPAISTALAAAGPIGWILGGLGAAIGGGVGWYKASKAKNEKIIDEQLKSKGIERKGNYSRGSLKDIDKALQTGKMSDSLRRKLTRKGDIAIVNEIEKKKEALEAKELKKKEAKTRSKFRINKAEITIGSASILNGGFGAGLLVKGIKETGFNKSLSNLKKLQKKNKNNADENLLKTNSINVNINGSLKLVGDNGQSVDIISELKRNPQMLREVSQLILKEIRSTQQGLNVGD